MHIKRIKKTSAKLNRFRNQKTWDWKWIQLPAYAQFPLVDKSIDETSLFHSLQHISFHKGIRNQYSGYITENQNTSTMNVWYFAWNHYFVISNVLAKKSKKVSIPLDYWRQLSNKNKRECHRYLENTGIKFSLWAK